jgi:hypothetical protein
VSTTSAAATIDVTGVLPPASSAAIVWLAPPACTKPDDRPASAFEPPIATSSRLSSIA